MKLLRLSLTISLSAITSTITTALLIPKDVSNHILSARVDLPHESTLDDPFRGYDLSYHVNDGFQFYQDSDAFEPMDWSDEMPYPTYDFAETSFPYLDQNGDLVLVNWGWGAMPMFDPGADFSLPDFPYDQNGFPALESTTEPSNGFVEIEPMPDFNFFGGAQYPQSLQEMMIEQTTAMDAKTFVSNSPKVKSARFQGRLIVGAEVLSSTTGKNKMVRFEFQKGKKKDVEIPEGYEPKKNGKVDTKLGFPLTLGNRPKEFFLTWTGRVRDKTLHYYLARGERVDAEAQRARRLIDAQNGVKRKKGGSQKRDNLINTIGKMESSSSTTNTTSFQTQKNQFLKYLDTYYAVQANVSALVLPFINKITDNTNNTHIRDVARSAYVEIVGLPIGISGPFISGMNCLSWLENQYFNGTNNTVAAIAAKPKSNLTSDEIGALQYFQYYQTLLSVYNHAYYNGSKIANSTGLLEPLHKLKRYMITNNTSIMPEEFTTANTNYMKQLFPEYVNSSSST